MRLAISVAVILLATSPSALAADIETVKGTVSVPDAPQRVLVLNPALAGSVYALDIPVLAVTASTRAVTEEGFSALWADLAREAKTEVLPWDFAQLNFELILSYNPDLIIAGGQGRPGFLANEAYDQLSAIAPTLFVDTAITTWQGELEFLGTALSRPDQVTVALDNYAARVATVKDAIALPPQPTGFLLSLEDGRAPSFLPEDSATPRLFAEVGFEPDALHAKHPDVPLASTGDSASLELEQVSDILTSPSLVMIPWGPASPTSDQMKAVAILQDIPAVKAGEAYDFPDFAYRFDYYGALAVLDLIEETFAK
jgi:iron complex transport system substrate-binding protein